MTFPKYFLFYLFVVFRVLLFSETGLNRKILDIAVMLQYIKFDEK